MLGFVVGTGAYERRSRPAVRDRRGSRMVVKCSDSMPSSPEEALRSWKSAREVKPVELDARKKTITVLFLCDNCWRAIFAEKQMVKLADEAGVGDRLLILSAGYNTQPGAAVPEDIIEQAGRRGIDLNDQNPCAAFDLREDLENYDYIICLDRRVRSKMLVDAENLARRLRRDYTAWESKVRLMRDLGGDKSLTQSAWELDISKFNTIDNETVMNDIETSCGDFLKVLRERGGL